jgi:hypothetical protein
MNQSIYRTMVPLEVSEGGARGYGPIYLYFAPPSCQKKGGTSFGITLFSGLLGTNRAFLQELWG